MPMPCLCTLEYWCNYPWLRNAISVGIPMSCLVENPICFTYGELMFAQINMIYLKCVIVKGNNTIFSMLTFIATYKWVHFSCCAVWSFHNAVAHGSTPVPGGAIRSCIERWGDACMLEESAHFVPAIVFVFLFMSKYGCLSWHHCSSFLTHWS